MIGDILLCVVCSLFDVDGMLVLMIEFEGSYVGMGVVVLCFGWVQLGAIIEVFGRNIYICLFGFLKIVFENQDVFDKLVCFVQFVE